MSALNILQTPNRHPEYQLLVRQPPLGTTFTTQHTDSTIGIEAMTNFETLR